MGNFIVDSNISRSDDHIGLDETEDYYDLDTGNDTTLHNITLDYCDVSCERNIETSPVNAVSGAPEDHQVLRPLHCHRLRYLLRVRRGLCIFRLPLLQSNHVLVRVHLWFHRGLSHLRGGESAAGVEQCGHRHLCRAAVWSDHHAGAVRGALHAGFPHRFPQISTHFPVCTDICRVTGGPGWSVLPGVVLRATLRLADTGGPPRHRPRVRSTHSLLSSKDVRRKFLSFSFFSVAEKSHNIGILLLRGSCSDDDY